MDSNNQLNKTPNNLHLLYEKDELYIVPNNSTEPAISYEGINKHQTIIVYQNPNSADKELLEKILAALGITMNTVKSFELDELIKSEESVLSYVDDGGYLLLFGVTTSSLKLSIDIEPYIAVSQDIINVLVVDDLSKIGSDTDTKRKLWGVLKELYKV